MHLRYMQIPLLQVPVIRILWMVPIYAVDSWLALRFSWTDLRTLSLYINVARECYEAFVVYNFLIFLARYVAITSNLPREESSIGNVARSNSVNTEANSEEGSRKDELRSMDVQLKRILARKPAVSHIFPMDCILEPWDTTSTAHHDSCLFLRCPTAAAPTTLTFCRYASPQPSQERSRSVYRRQVDLRACCIHLEASEHVGRGAFAAVSRVRNFAHCDVRLCSSPLASFFWAAMVTNFSQAWALYCLILFYKGLRQELAPMKPLGKFVAVKAIVFFSFWQVHACASRGWSQRAACQSLAIAILVQLDVIAEIPSIYPETSELAAATQDFLICIEMLIFAIVHHSVFSYREFLQDSTHVSNIDLDVEHSESGRQDFKSRLPTSSL
eukprot:759935-Hanusia_phi.AAC.5